MFPCPWWCQHIINVTILTNGHNLSLALNWRNTSLTRRGITIIPIRNSPELRYPPQLELHQVIILIHEHIHVSFQTSRCIETLNLEAQLNVVIWVGADDEVDIVPVSEQTSLDIANSLRQMLPV